MHECTESGASTILVFQTLSHGSPTLLGVALEPGIRPGSILVIQPVLKSIDGSCPTRQRLTTTRNAHIF